MCKYYITYTANLIPVGKYAEQEHECVTEVTPLSYYLCYTVLCFHGLAYVLDT